MTVEQNQPEGQKCCDMPDQKSRWTYSGDDFKNGHGYCKTCNATWSWSHEQKRMVRTDDEGIQKRAEAIGRVGTEAQISEDVLAANKGFDVHLSRNTLIVKIAVLEKSVESLKREMNVRERTAADVIIRKSEEIEGLRERIVSQVSEIESLKETIKTSGDARRMLLEEKTEKILKLESALKVAEEALKACCEKEPDGFGSYVVEEFETNAVLDGRKALQTIRSMRGGE